MEDTVSTVTEILMNILLGTISLSMLSWMLVAVQSFINDKKQEKRNQEKEKRDAEYHLERMKELRK